ncbi:ubiquinone biosynthesis protein COQ9-B, mitochondrial-like isoform X2 [Spodoptera litura]|uniref:Ubiquinone biosynthesis protein n=1 Tax=Spodoptera litura TaxID=69820 RepID=A0A9J7IVS2_SPOLT|nr:ubiquinone biosynthesis protein COQ9-B, mitochondrial-like isoform X2 [Spodoptera litura]
MSQSVDVVDLISTLLDNEKYKEALNASNEKKLTATIKNNSSDLISAIVGKIKDDTVTIKPSLYGTCEQLLSIIIEECAPEEALLEFIEQLELAKNDAQFGIILLPLQQILKKLAFKRGRSLEWCFNSISSYIEDIPVPEHHLEGEERLLMDSDPNIRRIVRVYSLLPPFYKYFIDEVNQADFYNVKTKEIIAAFLISLLALKNGHRTLRPFASIAIKRSQGISSQIQINPEKDTKLTIPATYTTSSEHEQEDHQYEENIKKNILENALQFVPKNGWSVESLSAGAKAAGYPTITHGLFPNGGADLVHYFNVRCNERLVDAMKTWPKVDTQEKVPAKFVENAIYQRLLMIDPYKSTWPKAMAIQTLPNNVPNCLATLLSLVDDICYHSGDRSVDFNWYMRRVGVAGIYKAAELFYLTDSSQDCNATRNFIASRIRDAQLIQTALNLSPVAAAPQTLTAAFTTAKNMLGINTLK